MINEQFFRTIRNDGEIEIFSIQDFNVDKYSLQYYGAWCSLHVKDNCVYFSNLIVHDHTRRKGLATVLIQHCIRTCKECNVNLYLGCRPDNQQWVHDWYKRLGFIPKKKNPLKIYQPQGIVWYHLK